MRASLFQINGVKKEPLVLPEPEGEVTTLTEKVYVPVKEHPDVSTYIGIIIQFRSEDNPNSLSKGIVFLLFEISHKP